MAEKNKDMDKEYEQISGLLHETNRRSVELAKEKGASSWLTCLPLEKLGYVLNKMEFRDSIALRYGWPIKNIPKFCASGVENDIDHILSCKKGGYVSLRHNSLRDATANILRTICKDVQVEPTLSPTTQELVRGTTSDDGARLDVSVRGLWSPFEKTLIDVRVTHPNAPSNRSKSAVQIYKEHENQKKRLYLDRILQVEKASFTPLVFSTTGGAAPEAKRFIKQVASRIAEKKHEKFSDAISYLRTRLRFTILRATLIAVRGYRGKPCHEHVNEEDISFNLIPAKDTYESR